MTETSQSLLELAGRASDAAAWSRLTGIYTPLLKAKLAAYGVQSADADDLIQEVLLAVSRELPTFEHSGRPGAFRRWLRTILANRLRNFQRNGKYRAVAQGGSAWADALNELEDDASDRGKLWNLEHDRHVVARLMEQVRPRFEPQTWDAFRRQVVDGLRADAVAAELNMPLNSVYVARSRVLATLRREAAGLVDV